MLIDTIAYLKMNCPNMTDDIGGAMWEQASKYFIDQAVGEVRGFVTGADTKAIYLSLERKRIQDSSGISRMVGINLQ